MKTAIYLLLLSILACIIYRARVARGVDSSTQVQQIIQNTIETRRKLSDEPKLLPTDLIYNSNRKTVPIVNVEFKIIFFQVAKTATTQFTRLFMRLADNPQWNDDSFDVHSRENNNLTYLYDFSLEEAEQMMINDEWEKVIFVRHPKPRMLSAFLDKAVHHSKHFERSTCQVYASKGGGNLKECIRLHENFEFFLKKITTSLNQNVHWRSITSRIDEKWWPKISFVGNMEHLSRDTENLLKSRKNSNGVTAFARTGKTGLSEKSEQHKTDSNKKLARYYTPELERFIEKRYEDDLKSQYFSFEKLVIFRDETISNKGIFSGLE
jgi:hypothetical protein